jgi:CelD/BcsL family acetyltransferase involved in cellulose biosynthesis
MRSILDSLRGDEANFALLNKVRADSPLCQFAIESASPLCRDHFPSICLHCSVDLGGVEDFYQRLPKKTRHNLKWEAKKLLDDHSGQVKVFCFREPAELDRMIKDIEQVAKTTYQRSLGVGFKATPELFGRMVHEAREGRLRAYVLYVNEKPCAFWLGYVCHDILYVDCTGYDSSLRKYSPGKYLLMKVFEDSGREGLSKVDCGYGDEWYKEHFGTSQWSEIITYLFAPTRKGIGLNVLRTAAILTDRTLRWGLRRTALFPWIKRHWRNRLRRKVSIVEATG